MSDDTLAIDVGTHAARALIFGPEGDLRAASSRPLALDRAPGGRVEQDPDAMLAATRNAIAEVLATRAETPARAGMAVQRSSVLLWNRESGEALTPVLSWQDTRAADRLEPLAKDESEIVRRTGLRLSPHYGASKLAWLREGQTGGDVAGGPLAAWLAMRLCMSSAQVDHASASRTLLWNLETRTWDPWLCERFGVPMDTLPACRPIRHDYGRLEKSEIPLTALDGDQNAAALADGPLPPAHALVNLGTGAFVIVPTGVAPVRVDRLLTGILDSDADGASHMVEGTVNGAGAAFTWAERRHRLEPLAPRLDHLRPAADAPMFLNAVGGLGSPWWRHDIEPRFIPEAQADEAAIADSVLDSVLFLLRANLDAIDPALRARPGDTPLRALRVTGGLARSRKACERLAVLTGLPVERPDQGEATARGVAWLAAGRPALWRSSPLESFAPGENRELVARYESWLAMMKDLP